MRNMRVVLAALVLLVVGTAAAALSLADPAAVLVQVAGKVEVQRAGKTGPATVGSGLEAGDRLLVPAGGRAVLMYRTGKIETVTSTTTIEARQSAEVGNLYRQTAQTIARVATTDAGRQPNRQGMIRPVAGEATPIAPRNDIRVLDVRPTFTWHSVTGAHRYMVQLRRTDVDGARPVRLDAGADTVWTYPSTEPALVPGATYQWTVAPTNGRAAAAQAFRVIGAAEFAALSDMMAEIAAAGADPSSDGLFLAALWYRDAGLFYEAERALQRMNATGDAGGRMFHLLHGDVLDRVGRLEEASRAFQAADAESGE